jgi:hypothetical protein
MRRPSERHPVAGCRFSRLIRLVRPFGKPSPRSNSTLWSRVSTLLTSPSLRLPLQPQEASGKRSLSLMARSGTDSALTELEKPSKGGDYGYFIDRHFSGAFARWWGLGIFSLAPVAPAGHCCEPSSTGYSMPRCSRRDSSLIRLSKVPNVVTQLGCAQITSQQTPTKD